MAIEQHTERWLPVVGFEGRYEVSNHGRVRSLLTHKRHVLSPTYGTGGYHRVALDGRSKTIHSLVAIAFVGPRPPGLDINHLNGIKTDNRPENLEYCTRLQNVIHSIRCLGNPPPVIRRGRQQQNAKLTEEKVRQIRTEAATGVTIASLSRKYGVCHSRTTDVIRRRAWSHVD